MAQTVIAQSYTLINKVIDREVSTLYEYNSIIQSNIYTWVGAKAEEITK